MSYRGDGPGAPYGVPGAGHEELRKGSVRAARERLQAERERSQWAQRQQGPDLINSPPPMRADTQYAPASTTGPARQVPGGPNILSPDQRSPIPQQWPLRTESTTDTGHGARVHEIAASGPVPPLQKPSRSINAPTHFDTSQDSMTSSSMQPPQAAYWQDDDFLSPTYLSPNMSRPLTNSSMTSDTSSIGSIPDFPVPSVQMPPAARRNQPYIGPPPSARRGPSSYYSQVSYVSPIVEEAAEARRSVGSFASSNVIPAEIPDFYLEDASDEEDEAEAGADGHDLRETDHNEKSGLVRQASLGKRSKPNLTTIKSGENLRPVLPSNAQAAIATAQSPQAQRAAKQAFSRSQASPIGGGGSILLDPSSSSEESLSNPRLRNNASAESLNVKGRSSYDIMAGPGASRRTPPPSGLRSPINRSVPRSPLVPGDSRVEHILEGLEQAGALGPGSSSKKFRDAKKGSLADRVGSRRPPRLNVDAVRDAEVRGSLTSLPDLIKRATKLAANLDRGKTASRLGFEWGDGGNYEKQNRSREFTPWSGNTMDRQKTRRSTTLSGMLSAFPPPGASTPGSPRTNWPGETGSSARSLNPYSRGQYSSPEKDRRGRYCCGIPLWIFFLLMVVLLFLVVAAVVIPVVLIVLPKHNAVLGDASNARAVCQKKSPCENGGGSHVLADGSCGCLCTNGFTGARCTNPSDSGCTSMSVAGVKNASVGSQIPPLLEAAASNYSLPLSAPELLSLFASTGMTCGAENALVTLTGSSAKRSETPSDEQSFDYNHRLPLLKRSDTNPPTAAVTSNGIVVAGGASPTPTATSAPSSTSAAVIATGSSAPGTNVTSKDFARAGLLFVLQDSRQIDVAVKAQEKLSQYMNSATKQGSTVGLAHNVTLGSGYFIDLWYWTVTLANGTVYGNGFNGTATALILP